MGPGTILNLQSPLVYSLRDIVEKKKIYNARLMSFHNKMIGRGWIQHGGNGSGTPRKRNTGGARASQLSYDKV